MKANVAGGGARGGNVAQGGTGGSLGGGGARGTQAACSSYQIPSEIPRRLVYGPDGNIWLTQRVLRQVVHTVPGGSSTAIPFPLAAATLAGIVAGPDGNIWVAYSTPMAAVTVGKIARITPSGAITEFSLPGSMQYGPIPLELAVGPDGNIWFTEDFSNARSTATIGRITMSGDIVEFPVEQSGAFSPRDLGGIVSGPDGNVWFTESGSDLAGATSYYLGRITPAGDITHYPAASGSMPLIGDMVVGADQSLWASILIQAPDVTSGTMYEVGIARIVAPIGDDGLLPITVYKLALRRKFANDFPGSLALGTDGNIWFAEEYLGNMSTTGVIKRTGSTYGASGFNAVTSGTDGNIWAVQRTLGGLVVTCIRPP